MKSHILIFTVAAMLMIAHTPYGMGSIDNRHHPAHAYYNSCPNPTAFELNNAVSYAHSLLTSERFSQWRSSIGLRLTTDSEPTITPLIGGQYSAECDVLNQLVPFNRGGLDQLVYFKVQNAYIVVPSYLFLGRDLAVGFSGPPSWENMHAVLLK
jgi:hypothetical protein